MRADAELFISWMYLFSVNNKISFFCEHELPNVSYLIQIHKSCAYSLLKLCMSKQWKILLWILCFMLIIGLLTWKDYLLDAFEFLVFWVLQFSINLSMLLTISSGWKFGEKRKQKKLEEQITKVWFYFLEFFLFLAWIWCSEAKLIAFTVIVLIVLRPFS